MNAAMDEDERLLKEFRRFHEIEIQRRLLESKAIEKYASAREKANLLKLVRKRQNQRDQEKSEQLALEFIRVFEYVAKSVGMRFNEESRAAKDPRWTPEEIPDQEECERDWDKLEKKAERIAQNVDEQGKQLSDDVAYKLLSRSKFRKHYKGFKEWMRETKEARDFMKASLDETEAKFTPPLAPKQARDKPRLLDLRDTIPAYEETHSWLDYTVTPALASDSVRDQVRRSISDIMGGGALLESRHREEEEKYGPLFKAYNLAVFHLISGDLPECRDMAKIAIQVMRDYKISLGHLHFIFIMAGDQGSAASVREEEPRTTGNLLHFERTLPFEFIIALRDNKYHEIIEWWIESGTARREEESQGLSLNGKYFPRHLYFDERLLHVFDFCRAIVQQDHQHARHIVQMFKTKLEREGLKSIVERGALAEVKWGVWPRLAIFQYIEMVETLLKQGETGTLFTDYLKWKQAMGWV